jgi:2,3-bisphosphoglycerate-independent phosphoglycerate mutase
MSEVKNKVVLIILDGFGISSVEEGNATLLAKTPILDAIWQNFPKTLLKSSGEEVGLPWGEMGNSEVGHLNLGTGRIIEQDLPRINNTIIDGSFFDNTHLLEACDFVKKNKSTLHLFGLVSDGGIHSDVNHLLALIDLAQKQSVGKIAIHIITDGRDMPAKSAERVIKKIEEKISNVKSAHIATIIGRFYAMDRDKNWDRIEKAYNLLVSGEGDIANDWKSALEQQYSSGVDDEKIIPILLDKNLLISDNDAVIMYNFRQDRSKQIAETLINPNFTDFKRKKVINNLKFVSFVSYGNEQTPLVSVAYMAEKVDNQIASVISKSNLKQLHIAETEKYAHVTYFFNGGQEQPYNGEDRIIIPSPKVKAYNLAPKMSALEVTNKFLNYFKSKSPDFSVINFANPDMVGHTGDLKATVNAIETVDECLAKIIPQIVNKSTSVIITADHGNCEQMINPQTKEIDKEHTTNPIFLSLVNGCNNITELLNKQISYEDKITYFSSQPTGVLADVSPTILNYLGIDAPSEMNGMSLKDVI